ncbi:MAG: hypothetical protein RMJ59_01770 [Candidatus Nitrosocaldus sp.]|nr:hypothetical protein [Candidatus Nitrosocaldus sp.]MCS7140679.1 hypothetical protein [Candidatus Nitrosocaldus sp.]MDW7999506.1 hypothetical protein [Candidatus Nitrosocaldus sp.]MDW8275094.1 hypothetical protein [Candidatus Nitrosocaldus sp.]
MDYRHRPRLPRGFRYLTVNDDLSSFSSNSAVIDSYIRSSMRAWLVDYYDRYIAIVYGERDILGLMVLQVHDEYMEIVVLAKDYRRARHRKVGSMLAVLAESIARELGKREIRLEAMQGSHRWWNETMRYEQYMPSYVDPVFGMLTPKRKFL